jgi:hopanoid biosynthesis associated protein HpnK
MPDQPSRRLIVNADDFGRSHSINRAVIQAHQRGILTTASLMVTGAAAEEAIALAHEHPCLGVGLHLTLSHGNSALPHSEIPDLVDREGNFSNNAVAAGFKYFALRRCHDQIAREVAAQFAKFRATGLVLDHVNGHLHFHLHPAVFKILMQDPRCRDGRGRSFDQIRLTRDPFFLNASLASGHWFYRITHAMIFSILSARSAVWLDLSDIAYTRNVFGLLQNGRVDEPYIQKLLPKLPPGDSELYSHPSLDEFKHEYDALVSPAVRELVERLGIKLIRYADL